MKAGPQKLDTLESADHDTPLLDLSDRAVKEMIRIAKKRGYVTNDQIHMLLASEEANSEQIESILAKFSEMGINVVESKEARVEEGTAAADEPQEEQETPGETELVEVRPRSVPAKSAAKEPAERSDDPVRIYLREMSSVELLTREGEIAIAKRLEAGREAMITGLCECPLTFQAITIWRDELNDGKALLRDIIDIDATYDGPDATAEPAPQTSPESQTTAMIPVPGQSGWPPQSSAPSTAPANANPFDPTGETTEGNTTAASENNNADDENWVSIAAIEAQLKPAVVKSLDSIAGAYKRLRRLQDQDIHLQLKRLSLSPAQERKYKKLKREIFSELKSLRLNRARVDALVEQLYDINKRLVGHEGRLVRLAEAHGIVREDFLKNYLGSELDPFWLNRVSNFPPRAGRTSSPATRTASRSCAPRLIRSPKNTPTEACSSLT